MKSVLALTVSILVCGAGRAPAQTDVPASDSHVGVAVKASTMGVGFEVATPVAERANVRVGFNVFGLSHDFDRDGIALAAQLKLRSFDTHFDWFPLGGGFHVSPGLMLYNGNEVDATAAVPGGKSFTLGGTPLVSNPASPVGGTTIISFARVAPSVVVGWGSLIPRGDRSWSLPFEVGVLLSRAPSAVIALNGSACSANGTNCRNIATDPGLQTSVASEQARLNSDLSPFKVLPVISLGFSYRF
jgi:hypothetical protein